MTILAPGANAAASSARSAWPQSCDNSPAFGNYSAIVLLPMDGRPHPQGGSVLFQIAHDSMEWIATQEMGGCNLDPEKLLAGSDRVLHIVCTFSTADPFGK